MQKKMLTPEQFCQEVGDFLCTAIPKEKSPTESAEIIFFNETDVSQAIAEGPKQRFVTTAVFDTANERVFCSFTAKYCHCEDHFPKYPMLPLGKLGQIMAQVGSLLILFTDEANEENGKKNLALVKSVQSIESFAARIANKKKFFIIPEDRLLMVAEYQRGKITTRSAGISVFICGSLVATMDLTYELLAFDLFSRFYNRQKN